MGARGERVMRSEGSKGERMGKAYCILGFRVPTTSVGARGKRGVKGSKVYCILGFRVPTTSVRGRGKGSEGGQRERKGVKGSERERRGAKGSEGFVVSLTKSREI